jgi:hypothetical protein
MKRYRDHWVSRAFSPAEDDARSMHARDQWAREGEKLDSDDRLWKQYLVLVDLYKFYLDIAWKAAVGYYFGTGILLAYYMDRVHAEPERVSLMLVFVAIVSLGFSYLMWRGAHNLASMIQFLEHIALTLRIPGRPHVEFAVVFLVLNSVVTATVAVGSLVLFLFTEA